MFKRNTLLINLILIIFFPPNLYSFTVTITMLNDYTYNPTSTDFIVYGGLWKNRILNQNDTDLATITLHYTPQEIGTDSEAGTVLARKEAAKLGATAFYFVSATEYTQTQDIASETYHLLYSQKDADLINKLAELKLQQQENTELNKMTKEYNNEIYETDFGKKLKVYLDNVSNLPPSESLRKMGLKGKISTLKTGKEKNVFVDASTGLKVSDDEVYARYVKLYDAGYMDLIKGYYQVYVQDLPRLKSINANYQIRNSKIQVIYLPDSDDPRIVPKPAQSISTSSTDLQGVF